MVNKYRVSYDSHQDDAFSVHNNIGIIKFRSNKQGLYVFNTTYNTAKSNVVSTAEENMLVFTSRQIERAKLSTKIYNNVGMKTVKKFKHMVSTNMIYWVTVIHGDVQLVFNPIHWQLKLMVYRNDIGCESY